MRNILNEFDTDRNAIIEPWYVEKPIPGFPEIAVSTFSKSMIDSFAALDGVEQISKFHSGGGSIPIYRINYNGTPVAFYLSKVGAPAAVMQLEESIAKGSKTVVVFGCCGVLDKEIVEGHFIVPTCAIRDEGTSYHYEPASDEIFASEAGVAALSATMDKMGYPWIAGKTWTTDAVYRETANKTAVRKSQGCISVEMECAAMFAVAKYRNVKYAQFLYAADNLDASNWDPRHLLSANYGVSSNEKYMLVAFEAAIALHGK